MVRCCGRCSVFKKSPTLWAGLLHPHCTFKNVEVQSKNFKRVNIFSLISEICNASKISPQHRLNFLPLNQNVVSNLAENSDYLSRFISKRKSEPQLYAHRISNVFFFFFYIHYILMVVLQSCSSPTPEARVTASSARALQTECSSCGRGSCSHQAAAWRQVSTTNRNKSLYSLKPLHRKISCQM